MPDLLELMRRTELQVGPQLWLRARALPHLAGRGHVARAAIVRRYLQETSEPKLHVGAGGSTLSGWLNSDLLAGDIYLDLVRPLPLPSAAFAYAYGEHVIEHVPERTGLRLLRELHRVLRPGGVLRLTTPDLSKLLEIYADRSTAVSRADYARFLDHVSHSSHERGCQILNTAMRSWGHRFIYDEEELTTKLLEAGFASVERREAEHSQHSALRDLERHEPRWAYSAEAMSLEAARAAR